LLTYRPPLQRGISAAAPQRCPSCHVVHRAPPADADGRASRL